MAFFVVLNELCASGCIVYMTSVDKLNWAIVVQIITYATSINTFYFYRCVFLLLFMSYDQFFVVGILFLFFLVDCRSFLLLLCVCFFLVMLLLSLIWICSREKMCYHALKCKQLTSLSINYRTSNVEPISFIFPRIFTFN